MSNVGKFFATVGVIILVLALIFVVTPARRYLSNKLDFIVQKVDDSTNYETVKKVEDTCRAMIASYNSDKLTYEQYDDSDSSEKQSWAEQAKMRANKTASTYNTYILQNSFVWSENVPSDIMSELPYLD